MNTTMQKCVTCGAEKPRTAEFFTVRIGRGVARAVGFRTQCNECRKRTRTDAKSTPEQLALRRATRKPKPTRRLSKKDVPEGHKRCSECLTVKPMTTEFFYKGSGLGGLDSKCVVCQRARSMTPEAVEQRKAYHRAIYADPAVRRSARRRMRAWVKENPERHRLNQQAGQSRRRTRKADNGGSHTADDILFLIDAQQGLCAYCEIELLGYHVDHVHPVARGGTDNADNLAISCPLCNHSKGYKLLSEWVNRPTKEESAEYYLGYRRTPRRKPRSGGWTPFK